MSTLQAEAGIRMPALPEFIAIIATMMALTALSIDIMLPALPAMAATFGLDDPNSAQLVVTAYLLGFAAGQIAYGPLSDRFGRKPVLLAGLVIYAAASSSTLLAPDYATFLLARFMQGIGCAAPRVIAMAVVRDVFGGRQMARVMSFVMMVFIVVPVLAPGVGELLLIFARWQWIFAFMLAVSLLLMALTALRLPETRAVADREALTAAWLMDAVRETISNRQTFGYTLATTFVFGSLMGYINSTQQIFVGVYDLGRLFPLFFGGIAVAMAFASFANGRLVPTFGMRRLSHGALLGFVTTAVLHLTLALAFSGPPPLAVFCGLLALNSFFFGIMMPNFNAMAMDPVARIAGTASSFIGAFTTAGAAVLGWAIGQHFDGTVLPLLVGYAVLGAIALAVVIWTEGGLFRPRHGA